MLDSLMQVDFLCYLHLDFLLFHYQYGILLACFVVLHYGRTNHVSNNTAIVSHCASQLILITKLAYLFWLKLHILHYICHFGHEVSIITVHGNIHLSIFCGLCLLPSESSDESKIINENSDIVVRCCIRSLSYSGNCFHNSLCAG